MSKKFELKCPNCGNDGKTSDANRQIQHLEWMPVFRTVEGVEERTVFVDYDNYQDMPEGAKDPHFFCQDCQHEWPCPDGLTMSGADDLDGPRFSEMDEEDQTG